MPIQELRIDIAEETLAALVIIVDKKGYFIKQGIKPIIQPFKAGKQALVDGLLANPVDIATTANVPIVFNTFQRNDFKIVANIASSDNEPLIIARKDSHI